MDISTKTREKVTIIFAGDSGDGIQLAGFEFSNTAALYGNDLSTFPDFPAEIRAPQGTVSGVSGFKINFGSSEIYTPGGMGDVLVAMNAAALKKNLENLKPQGLVIANTAGFDPRNLKLAKYPDGADPLAEIREKFKVIEIDVTRLTRDALSQSNLGMKERDRSRNMFVLGFLYWLYHRELSHTEQFLRDKFRKHPDIAEANIMVLRAGFAYGETTEAQFERFEIGPAKLPPGTYRNIVGNQGLALGLIAAAHKARLDLFYAGYPITPASDILHELSRHKNFGVKTFQAEDEIAAITASIGASFAGGLGITASSGPGIALKTEALGLAVMLELPLVVINVQRGGPSTGLPTKTEQADLFQAIYGRNGEAPIPVIAPHSPKDTFMVAYEATRMAIENMTPVIILSDGYIANGAEPWRFPDFEDLAQIVPPYAKKDEPYLPYHRDEKGVRSWAIPGTPGLEHRVGGLEKENETGNVSYEPENHALMTHLRDSKVRRMAEDYPPLAIDSGEETGDVLVLGWGSTYGSIKTAVRDLQREGIKVSHIHLRHLYPLPNDLGNHLKNFKMILVPEINNGQMVHMIRDRFLVDAIPLNKVKGLPFLAAEIRDAIRNLAEKTASE